MSAARMKQASSKPFFIHRSMLFTASRCEEKKERKKTGIALNVGRVEVEVESKEQLDKDFSLELTRFKPWVC